MKEELGQAGGPAEECWGLLTKMECRISFSAPPPHPTEHHHIFILLRRRWLKIMSNQTSNDSV